MKKIILVSGAGNSGKTTSIKLFLNNIGMFHLRDGDITVIFNLTVDGRQVAVGVASGGDTEKVVRENLKFFESHSCEYIVCASKSRGKTIELVTEFAKKHDLHLCEIKTNLKSKKAAHLDNVRVAAEIEKCIT